ncbi:uncharacterized protein LOC116801724 [Drosophila sechellia]|uniref:Uncharacterized protein LOC117144208 n=1 Tax=Drosophila mauritiana TaxID=7226 RepID=A0A6P8KM93_DROMA|nr:uncharacterized protein LOC108068777 [Drosophila takahashii]XP_032578785.1 uncharacterized protein LOC116801724 [Drosophila sechellia]XP_033165149.1 uncharacterized protein LOC117144208 [Drosophila mauritiana]KAH8351166.1 hypothetical protein KR084_008628 [Drosophila pseudotakahashii]
MGHLQLDFHSIPKLHGKENYWQWRILLKTFLEANDLWKHNEPKESPETKFLILASVTADKIEPSYDDQSCSYIFQNMESRFGPFS